MTESRERSWKTVISNMKLRGMEWHAAANTDEEIDRC